MANPEHLAILKQGVVEWNQWVKEGKALDFSDADLSDTKLDRVDLRGANLRGANLNRASLSHANLGYANFQGATFRHAKLYAADLRGAVLSGAMFLLADLAAVNLRQALVSGTDFASVMLGLTQFDDMDLSVATGLDRALHTAPSTVGIDTIYRSKGKIPEIFLRGCGVPEEFIEFARSVGRNPIEYYSCFISYSTKDQAFADRLYADLQAKGVRCWFAPHDIVGGRKIHEQLDEAIRLHDKLLLILSEHSMASDWVGTEIANARERESREKKQMLFPITIAPFEEVKKWKLFDSDRGKDSAREIREYYIPDFSAWERDAKGYQKEFEKLVGALKSTSAS